MCILKSIWKSEYDLLSLTRHLAKKEVNGTLPIFQERQKTDLKPYGWLYKAVYFGKALDN